MKNSQLLYKFKEIDKFAIDILVTKRLYLSSWATLNDPHEAVMYIETENYGIHANPQKLQTLDKQLLHKGFINDKELINPKVCSLSNTCSSNLLWSHYAAGHTGIAIGITLPSLARSIQEITVKYDDKIPVIKQCPLKKEDIIKALTHKSKEWIYEKEVRLVTFEPEKVFIENIEIKEIIFGLRTSKDDMRLISNIFKNTDVKFFKTSRKPGYYHLNRGDMPGIHKGDYR